MKCCLLLLSLAIQAGKVFDISPALIIAIAQRETNCDLYAMGDYDDDKNPQSFGPWQLHLGGVGADRSPDFLLDTNKAVYEVASTLAEYAVYFAYDYNKVISAWNQGVGGVESRGWEYNKPYVDDVLECWDKWGVIDSVVPWPD